MCKSLISTFKMNLVFSHLCSAHNAPLCVINIAVSNLFVWFVIKNIHRILVIYYPTPAHFVPEEALSVTDWSCYKVYQHWTKHSLPMFWMLRTPNPTPPISAGCQVANLLHWYVSKRRYLNQSYKQVRHAKFRYTVHSKRITVGKSYNYFSVLPSVPVSFRCVCCIGWCWNFKYGYIVFKSWILLLCLQQNKHSTVVIILLKVMWK